MTEEVRSETVDGSLSSYSVLGTEVSRAQDHYPLTSAHSSMRKVRFSTRSSSHLCLPNLFLHTDIYLYLLLFRLPTFTFDNHLVHFSYILNEQDENVEKTFKL